MKKLFWVLCACLLTVPALSMSRKPADVFQEFLAAEGEQWSVHLTDRGTVFALYGKSRSSGASAMEAATNFLQEYHDMLNIEKLSDLKLMAPESSEIGTHFCYQQYYSGLPVVGGQVMIHVNNSHEVIGVSSNYHTGLQGAVRLPKGQQPETAVLKRFGSETRMWNQGLMILPMQHDPHLVWRLEVASFYPANGSWLLYVDALDPNIVLRARKTSMDFEGVGNVWLENPISTPTRSVQTFPNMDETTSLSGKFVKVYDANFKKSHYEALSEYITAKSRNREYNYQESDAKLTEAMAYFHINRVHDRWRSLGFRKLNAPAPVFVNVLETTGGAGFDNAFYSRDPRFRKTGIYVFGAGNRFGNFGLDAEVLYHEYGHGVLDKKKPGLMEAVESNYPLAFHEAFGDISAAAISGNAKLADFADRNQETQKYQGRSLENRKKFPKNVTLPRLKISEPHYTGLIIGGAWWDLQKVIGALEAQKILYKSLSLLPNEMDFFDVRDAMLTADTSLNGAANNEAITLAFAKHGLVGKDPGQKGSISLIGLQIAGGPSDKSPAIQSTYQRGDIIYLVASYSGSDLTPGYNLVLDHFEFNKPSGSEPFVFPLMNEVRNGSHTDIDGLYLFEIDTDSNTTPGNYSFVIQARLGGTSKTFPQMTASFTLQ